MKNEVKLFEQQKVRTHWDEKEGKWYFSVIDVISILTESANPRDYWFKMKTRVKTEDGLELSTVCRQLKMKASDGKMRETDVAETQVLLRIIQSIPSPKAEPFKQWLAKVGYERMQEIANPEQSLDRARENWQKLGRSEKWIQQRMTGQETRNKLTDYWKESGVEKSDEFAFLTIIKYPFPFSFSFRRRRPKAGRGHTEWAGLSVKQHKNLKGLKTQNLRDHMSEAELIFTALAELSTRQIAETDKAKGVKQNAVAGKKGGKIAKDARLALENKTGRKVITRENFLPPSKQKKKLK